MKPKGPRRGAQYYVLVFPWYGTYVWGPYTLALARLCAPKIQPQYPSAFMQIVRSVESFPAKKVRRA